jgi:hypothetical protein
MGDVLKDKPARSISSDMMKLRRSKKFSYPDMRNVWPQDILDHQNTVSFDGNRLYNFFLKVNSDHLSDVVISVQTRQDNDGSSTLVFTSDDGQQLAIPLEQSAHYEVIFFKKKLLADFLQQVKRYSPSGIITMNINESVSLLKQFIFTATTRGATHMELLLMPVVR